MTPLEQIDFVLFYIKEKEELSASFSTEYIWNLYVSKTPESGINRTMFNEIIKQLVEDDYIAEFPIIDSAQKMYHVTFKGRVFTGYVAEQTALRQSQSRILALEEAAQKAQMENIRNSRRLNYLTLILAIGTGIAAVYYLLDILNHWFCVYPRK